eukprot:Gregarina_sp_Poly_1__1163@NODE_1284_length_4497_cov_74_202257_g6_i1_p2_GENE_NODE_1284_length_4497_cov_74_202257_g6_i1NODE_1284_length_4497_cov_74_202257_g6_i1_p2_ORF_typecomplete_len312_score38_39Metallophos/PF00149_28/3_2e45Metallophos_2/PF12850_7/4_8e05_NODE_1284_length_4497_cov_74_202257_g6_i135254460
MNCRSVDEMLAGLQNEEVPVPISELEVKWIFRRARDLLMEESNVQPVPAPVVVAGDIHGQFHDLLELFEVGGALPKTSYIFLGDYVDRGSNSVETFLYLVLLKLKYPARITLIRGNHESRQITQVYGFYDECLRKYGNASVWRMCTDLFDYLTLAAVVDGRVFCVHGGLSPDVRLIDQLRTIHRAREIPHTGAFGDVVWSDPDENISSWAVNPRGAGWLFGPQVTNEFCQLNDMELIARAHQLAMDGYQFFFPSNNLVTVWSAPNYCHRCGNVGAIMRLQDGAPTFKIFHETEQSRRACNQQKFSVGRYFY